MLNEKQTLTVNNKMELGENISDEAKGKGRQFVSRFIEPGVAHYQEFGDVLITKETLDKFINTMVGCPVIIQHKDIDDKNVDDERVGVVSKVWFNEIDGWFYCEGIIWDKQAIDLVKNQDWNVSCTYDFDSDNQPKTHNGKKIDREFTGGEFLHLALVPNPRYERANIVMNSIENAKDWDGNEGDWITVNGNHLFIKKGQSKDEVVKSFIEKQENKQETKKESNEPKWLKSERKKLDRQTTQMYEDREAIKKDENYKREADIALTMMAQDYEKRGNKGTTERANELREKLKKDEELSDKDKADIKIALEYYKDGGIEGIEEKRKKDQEKYEKEKEYYNKKQEEKLVEFKKEYPIGTKFIEKYFGQDREHSIQSIKLDDIDKAIIITDENGKEHHALARDITLTKEKSDLEKNKNIERNKSLLKADLTHMLKGIDRNADYKFEDSTQRLQVNDFGLWEKNEDGELQPTKETKQKVEQIKESFKKRFNLDLDSTWSEKKLYTFSIKNSNDDNFVTLKRKDGSTYPVKINPNNHKIESFGQYHANLVAYKSSLDSKKDKTLIDEIDKIQEEIKDDIKYEIEQSEDNQQKVEEKAKNIKSLIKTIAGKNTANVRVNDSKGYQFIVSRDQPGYSKKEAESIVERINKSKQNIKAKISIDSNINDIGYSVLVDVISKANNIGDVTMTVLNELKDFIKNVVKNEKDEEMKEVKNEDKRKLIDEVGGILKGKVDDEIIKTIIKKMEEASYEPSEDDKADNEADEEEKEEKFEEEKEVANKKAKNEEKEAEDKEVDKEEVKNKCKNSMNDVKSLIMGGSSKVKSNYITKEERFALGENY